MKFGMKFIKANPMSIFYFFTNKGKIEEQLMFFQCPSSKIISEQETLFMQSQITKTIKKFCTKTKNKKKNKSIKKVYPQKK